MNLTREEVKMIVSLQRQIDNYKIGVLVVMSDQEKVLKFDDNGWTCSPINQRATDAFDDGEVAA